MAAFRRMANGGGGVRRVGVAPKPTATTTASRTATVTADTRGPKYGPVVQVPIKRVMTDTGPLNIQQPSPDVFQRGTVYDPRYDPAISRTQTAPAPRFSQDQIREMLARGAAANGPSEFNERTGEPEAGQGPAYDLERQLTDKGAAADFAAQAAQTPPPPDTDTDAGGKPLGWLLLAALAYFTLGA